MPSVQSLTRALDLLDHLADAGGRATLSELAAASGLPAASVHRLLATLVAQGHVRREAGRRYALGPRLVRLGDVAGHVLGEGVGPALRELVTATGESANLAGLDGDTAVYLAQAPSPHPMRMFTEVGRRVPLHATGVGKALLAAMTPEEVDVLVARTGMPARTPATLTDPAALHDELAAARARGWVLDEGEQEVGVRCVAAPVPRAPTPCAVSVSGPAARFSPAEAERAGPTVVAAAARLGEELAGLPDDDADASGGAR
ncbi:IclR family transcriptional regulator [Actinomycetospora cinnamomea]|uniref:Glycerol operon regulatory protein n=1 Tax=Actinomycetospora cinnamomea TaxID=663609 RepID=A0A2U1FQX0_9PSEU|nr:IclR family transcriptional regulator [Actinomycetospora cinnamomea]PVZ14546.1 IclR family transcriptional regulator [Actinomycetospora cinnamomea]